MTNGDLCEWTQEGWSMIQEEVVDTLPPVESANERWMREQKEALE